METIKLLFRRGIMSDIADGDPACNSPPGVHPLLYHPGKRGLEAVRCSLPMLCLRALSMQSAGYGPGTTLHFISKWGFNQSALIVIP